MKHTTALYSLALFRRRHVKQRPCEQRATHCVRKVPRGHDVGLSYRPTSPFHKFQEFQGRRILTNERSLHGPKASLMANLLTHCTDLAFHVPFHIKPCAALAFPDCIAPAGSPQSGRDSLCGGLLRYSRTGREGPTLEDTFVARVRARGCEVGDASPVFIRGNKGPKVGLAINP